MSTHHKNVGASGQGKLFPERPSRLADAEREHILREKLYQKAKQEPQFRFYILYDKMFWPICSVRHGNESKPAGNQPVNREHKPQPKDDEPGSTLLV